MNVEELNSKIGEQIRLYREAKKMTQEEAAKQLGITRATWNLLENGKSHITVVKLFLVAKMLDVSPVRLLCLEDALGFDSISDSRFKDTEKVDVLSKLEAKKTEKTSTDTNNF